jgi:hypothetical protein
MILDLVPGRMAGNSRLQIFFKHTCYYLYRLHMRSDSYHRCLAWRFLTCLMIFCRPKFYGTRSHQWVISSSSLSSSDTQRTQHDKSVQDRLDFESELLAMVGFERTGPGYVYICHKLFRAFYPALIDDFVLPSTIMSPPLATSLFMLFNLTSVRACLR